MPSNHLILCHPFSPPPLNLSQHRVFSNESAPCIRLPKYWSFSFSIRPSNEYSGLISFRIEAAKDQYLQQRGWGRYISGLNLRRGNRMLGPYNDASVLGTHVPLLPSGLLPGQGATAHIKRSGPVHALLSHGPEISDFGLHWLRRARHRFISLEAKEDTRHTYNLIVLLLITKDVKQCIIKLGSYLIQISNL